jgi:two-component system, sensor histidine kinase
MSDTEQRPVTILNVDDYDAGRYAVTRALRQAGFTVLEAVTGQDALDEVERSRPDLILLDVQLPDINGVEIARRLRSNPDTSAIPILHLSATRVRDSDRALGLEAGADAYLVEPVDTSVLIATIRALLRVRRAEQEKQILLEREQAARRDAEAANRARDEFFAILSHELRTPMAAILGWVQYLRHSNERDAGTLEAALLTIEQSARAQSKLIDQILDASRIMTQKLDLELCEVDLTSLVRDALTAVKQTAEVRNISIDVEVDAGALTVIGDAARLQQVVWNIAANAIKFTQEGGRVLVTLRAGDGWGELSVEDNGRGIAPDLLPHIFERFRQSRTARVEGGLGLGLSLVRHLVELHGGEVTAMSAGEGEGSTFVVRLPLAGSRQ